MTKRPSGKKRVGRGEVRKQSALRAALGERKPQLSLDESSHGDREMSSWPSIEHNLICAGPVEPGLPEDRRHGTTVDVGRAFGGHEVAEGTFGCSHVARISREFIRPVCVERRPSLHPAPHSSLRSEHSIPFYRWGHRGSVKT